MKRSDIRVLKMIGCLCLALVLTLSFASCGAFAKEGDVRGMAPGYGSGTRDESITVYGKPTGGDTGDTVVTGGVTDGYGLDYEVSKTEGDVDGGEIWEKTPVERPAAGLLTAAEWSDAENWEFWMHLINENDWYALAEKWKIFATSRVRVRLGSAEAPIAGATVVLLDAGGRQIWQAVSDREGVADLFWAVDGNKDVAREGWTIRATVNDQTATVAWDGSDEVTVNGLTGSLPAPKLDLMFTVDTTGSMGDELEYLKEELLNVVGRVQTELQLRARVSVNFYRDEGDEYVVSDFGFGTVEKASATLKKQYAAGGGDYPEAVHTALKNSIVEHEWDLSDECVRLMFLVLDAPAHDTDKVKESLRASLTAAAAKGIRVIPVVCSGVEADCEELCRSMAVLTGGTYVFLTNDSGIGGSHLEATVGEHEVEPLNDLLVRVICEYCK